MPERIWSYDLNRFVEFKDGTSQEEMERLIREEMSKRNDAEVDDGNFGS